MNRVIIACSSCSSSSSGSHLSERGEEDTPFSSGWSRPVTEGNSQLPRSKLGPLILLMVACSVQKGKSHGAYRKYEFSDVPLL